MRSDKLLESMSLIDEEFVENASYYKKNQKHWRGQTWKIAVAVVACIALTGSGVVVAQRYIHHGLYVSHKVLMELPEVEPIQVDCKAFIEMEGTERVTGSNIEDEEYYHAFEDEKGLEKVLGFPLWKSELLSAKVHLDEFGDEVGGSSISLSFIGSKDEAGHLHTGAYYKGKYEYSINGTFMINNGSWLGAYGMRYNPDEIYEYKKGQKAYFFYEPKDEDGYRTHVAYFSCKNIMFQMYILDKKGTIEEQRQRAKEVIKLIAQE